MRGTKEGIPQVDIEKAVYIYYARLDLGTEDIKGLFGDISATKVTQLKQIARDYGKKAGASFWSSYRVPTAEAFEAWGLDIKDLEIRNEKLKGLRR
jgi:hypothetical protein